MDQILPFIQRHPILILAAGALIVALIVDEMVRRVQGKSDIPPNDAIRLINQGAAVIDLRGPEDFKRGHIGEAHNIPMAEFEQQAGKMTKGGRSVLAYCADGKDGAKAARLLATRGIDQVYNLKGGFAAWRRENLPVVKGK
ncbi:MAG TPA: rhodanese-like domain-containing protein [Gammaproteobacteria bacterium]|nr:rhodanese-like domain-containing protein [Gammaproteobacteria bacterium]HET7587049.1 rhodanese-like domain-containing protein [Gammaproteobacteria bacterium]